MIANRKSSGRSMSMPAGLAVGMAVSLALTVSSSLLLTKLVLSGVLDVKNIGYGTMILLLISSFAGACIAQGKIRHRRILVCMVSGLVYFCGLLGITAMFFGGQYTGIWATGLMILAGSGTATLATAGKGRRTRTAKYHGR